MSADEVIEFLKEIGCDAADDVELVTTLLAHEKQNILVQTNQSEFPSALDGVLLYRTVGRYLELKQSTGKPSFNVEAAYARVKVGDTEIASDTASAGTTLYVKWISYMSSYGDREIERYRKLSW